MCRHLAGLKIFTNVKLTNNNPSLVKVSVQNVDNINTIFQFADPIGDGCISLTPQ